MPATAPLSMLGRHARDQQVLPDGEADIAVAERMRDAGKAAHLRGGELADRQHDADPVQAGLLLRVHADMGVRDRTAGRGASASAGTRASLRPSFSSIGGEKLLKAPARRARI